MQLIIIVFIVYSKRIAAITLYVFVVETVILALNFR